MMSCDVTETSRDATYPQCHAITLATETVITKNTNPPMPPPIMTPTCFSSEGSSRAPLLGLSVDNGPWLEVNEDDLTVAKDGWVLAEPD